MPGIAVFQLVKPFATSEQLLIYYSADGWVAQLTGTEGKDVTDRLPQEQWAGIYSQAHAVLALTGDISKVPLKEIF